jgi:hypothetical protein
VTASEVTIPAKRDEAEVELRAAYGAVVGPAREVKVVASAKPGGKAVSDSATTKLTTLASPMPQADIVFVLDVTGSMGEQIRGLQTGIGTFADDLQRAKVDARFGCVAFRDLFFREENGFPSMEVLKFKGENFTPNAEAFSEEVSKQKASGGDDVPETSFEALAEAAKFTDWRKAATRVLVLITDAPPKIFAVPPRGMTVEEAAGALSKNEIDLLHLVVNPSELPTYRKVQQGAKGVGDKGGGDKGKEFDLRRTAGNAKTFTDVLLPEMTKAIVAAAEAKRPDTKPEVAKRPDEKPQLVKAVQSGESYDRGAAGQLVLAVGVWTGAIAALVCLFLVGGQHHYLRGTLPAAGGVLAGLVGGLIVGLVGGAAGQGLFLLADTDNRIIEAFFRVMGWTILGSLAGLGLSLFVPNLKLVYGLGGGAVGGAVGAIGYIAVGTVAGEVLGPSAGAVLGRLAGGLVLGLFIGLMVAVVEAAFRRAWLEVRYGPREVVTVNLGAEPVKVGGDARACTVWARGAADVALRYFIRDGRVICTDVPAREEEVVQDGDTREAGNVTVVVRTGSGAEPAPARPRTSPTVAKSRRERGDEERGKPREAVPARAPRREDDGKPPLLELGFDDDSPAVAPASPPPAPARPAAAPARPPLPTGARPPAPAAKPAAAPAAPAIKPATRDPDACPTCGRKNPGRPGNRYCMVCDQTY